MLYISFLVFLKSIYQNIGFAKRNSDNFSFRVLVFLL